MGWDSAHELAKQHTQWQIDSWTPSLDLAESLMHSGQRGGGLMGDTTLLHRVRAGLERDGLIALEYERTGRRGGE